MTQYLIHIHTQTCSFCHTDERYSHTYRCEDNDVRKLTAVSSIPDAAPAAILYIPPKTVTICSRCAPGRDGIRTIGSPEAWRDTLKRKAEAALRAKRDADLAAKRRPATLDDVL